jgi:hypothetical protein
LYQTLENKQKFIGQIMSSKSAVRSCEDIDETALSYAEIKALCAGNPLIAEKMNLDMDVAKLRMLKSEHQNQRYRLEDQLLKYYPEKITSVKERIDGIEKDTGIYLAQKEKTVDIESQAEGTGAVTVSAKFAGMKINGVEYTEKEPAAKALIEACSGIIEKKEMEIGEYMGFHMSLYFSEGERIFLQLRGNMTYETELSTDTFGNITRINHSLADLPKRLAGAKAQLEDLYAQRDAAKQELEKPFAQASELADKEARLALLNAELNIDGNGGMDVVNDHGEREDCEPMSGEEYEAEYGPEDCSAKSAMPSILESLRSYSPQKLPANPGKKTEDRDI